MAKASALEFKGVSLTVIQVQLRSCDPAQLHHALAELTGNAADFFADDLAVLDFSGISDWPATLDWADLRRLFRGSGLHPVATHGLPEALAASAAAAGLPPLADGALKRPQRPAPRQAAPAAAEEKVEKAEVAKAEVEKAAAPAAATPQPAPVANPTSAPAAAAASPTPASTIAASPTSASTIKVSTSKASPAAASPAPASAAPAASPAPAASAPPAPTAAHVPQAPPPLPPADAAILDKPLRSGQRFYARGRDLVVLAMVSSGAEVIADGNIHVYAPLRGRALAGASGDRTARIFTTCMEAELVSIAGIYRTFENGVPAPLRKASAMVSLGADPTSDALQVKPLSLS